MFHPTPVCPIQWMTSWSSWTPQEESTLTVCPAIQKRQLRPLTYSFSAWKTFSFSIVEKCCMLPWGQLYSQDARSFCMPPHLATHTRLWLDQVPEEASGRIPHGDSCELKITRWDGKEPLTHRTVSGVAGIGHTICLGGRELLWHHRPDGVKEMVTDLQKSMWDNIGHPEHDKCTHKCRLLCKWNLTWHS